MSRPRKPRHARPRGWRSLSSRDINQLREENVTQFGEYLTDPRVAVERPWLWINLAESLGIVVFYSKKESRTFVVAFKCGLD